MHLFGFAESCGGFLSVPCLMQCIGQRCSFAHSLKLVTATIRQFNALLGKLECLRQVANSQVKFAEVASDYGSIFPILRLQ